MATMMGARSDRDPAAPTPTTRVDLDLSSPRGLGDDGA
jgi:hypothetical protein